MVAGSLLEGGGQVLRTALGLAWLVVGGQPKQNARARSARNNRAEQGAGTHNAENHTEANHTARNQTAGNRNAGDESSVGPVDQSRSSIATYGGQREAAPQHRLERQQTLRRAGAQAWGAMPSSNSGRSLLLSKIRAGRSKPGLAAQVVHRDGLF